MPQRINIVMREQDGNVLVEFPEPYRWLSLPPELARVVAENLLAWAAQVETNRAQVQNQSETADRRLVELPTTGRAN